MIYDDGKLYRITRTMRYDQRDGRFHNTGRGMMGVRSVGLVAALLDRDPSATVELLPDPLPTTPGSVVRKYEDVYMRRDASRLTYPWTDHTGEVYPDSHVQGATVLFDAGAAS